MNSQAIVDVLAEYLSTLPESKVEMVGEMSLVFCRRGHRTTLVIDGGDIMVVGTISSNGDRNLRKARFPLLLPQCFELVVAEAHRQVDEINYWDSGRSVTGTLSNGVSVN